MQVGPQGGGEPAQGVLGRVVERRPRRGHLARQRGHEHEVTAPARDHRSHQPVGEDDRRAHVDGERPVDLLDRVGVERSRRGQGRVSDQHVHLARLLQQALHLPGLGQVHGQRARPELRGQWLEYLCAPPGEHELPAALAQRARDRVAQPAGRACQQHPCSRDLHARNPTPSECRAARRL